MIREPGLIAIAISTVSRNLSDVLEYVKGIDDYFSGMLSFIIISQLEDADEAYSVGDSIEVILSTDRGLSKSRNLALQACRSKWLWFQDDDIDLIVENIPRLIRFLESSDCDIVLGKIGSLENKEEGYKDYARFDVNPILLSLRVSSIEIIVRCSFARDKEVSFDECLGLGSNFPSCEENLFFYDAVVRNKARYDVYNEYICRHTTMAEGRNVDYEGRYRARGYMLGRMRSTISPIVIAWWSIRYARDEVSRVNRFKAMCQGYWEGINKKS